MPININTPTYWDQRFASGDWEQNRGRWQTASFAKEQVHLLRLPTTFDGSILDFGCGLGDALPVLRSRFPLATLIGVDHSEAAVIRCRETYGHIATFVRGGSASVPNVDVIIASNVLEHVTDDLATARALVPRCSELYIFVPYKEHPLCSEHVHYYDETSLSALKPLEVELFCAPGWSQYGLALWTDIYLKNLLRPLLGKPLAHRRKQIMFRIQGNLRNSASQFVTQDRLRVGARATR